MSYSAAVKNAAALLVKWGFDVTVNSNASTNGRPYDFSPLCVLAHHTAAALSASESASRRVVLEGRSDLSGPLAQVFIARDCSIDFLSFGRANHGGLGGPLRSVPKDSMNAYGVGVEVDNNGTTEQYNAAQMRTMSHVYAALLIAMGRDHTWLFGHKEWAPTRKIDPRLDMDKLRGLVHDVIEERTAPPPAPVQPSSVGRYIVRSGDTLTSIAEKYDTTWGFIRDLNGLKDEDFIQVGQVLRVPALRTHTVTQGDTLYSVAEKYGTTWQTLKSLNGLRDEDLLAIGQLLKIPV